MKRKGTNGQCSFCQATLPVPKDIYGQACCPRCSAQLWHLAFSSGPAFFLRNTGETIYDLLAEVGDHGLSAAEIERIWREADPLDLAEFLSDLEEAVRS
jgi:hypothetical protein